ncbi:hypothetical protein HTZ84_06565 [Haloterrigena sp. SYSU A558-1]|uniref:DUF8159 domain-containing protein n=1 Tax=Haloterrigena gelatinilytica TaxID=2741724 RepID=A0A8J8GPH8_9EURY|nr:hypothetical protein [Haloterrigena gelatinilytica]NUB92197.1 hypothetical protein [Haloterrigena gelatinilytica]NUC71973.1 hypothetical protein [Haloterrigena gelatinilytica]
MTNDYPIPVTLENRLMGQGIYVTGCELRPPDDERDGSDSTADDVTDGETATAVPDGAGIVLEYETVAETPAVDSNEVGTVVRTVLDIAAEREWSPGRLEATSLTTDGQRRGEWHVKREWFEGLGLEIDDLEFSQRVLGTVQSADG